MSTVIYHRSDYDGIFCREIAKKFLPATTLIEWDFGDPPIPVPPTGRIYVLGLPPDAPFGIPDASVIRDRLTWIDHHLSSMTRYPKGTLPGYQLGGVAACRLAWQYFSDKAFWTVEAFPEINAIELLAVLWTVESFVERKVLEPTAVRWAGEYDVFDHRDKNSELFQFGLKSRALTDYDWEMLLSDGGDEFQRNYVFKLAYEGKSLQYAQRQEYKKVISSQSFDLRFEELNFLACNSHCEDMRSALFTSAIKPHHDALLGFTFLGSTWKISMYGIPGKDIDLSKIASKYGGGGHKGAAGALVKTLPFLL